MLEPTMPGVLQLSAASALPARAASDPEAFAGDVPSAEELQG